MKNIYSGSSVLKKFLPAHLIYLLLCWGVIKCEPCGALWHGCVLWQHRVWPYGRARVWIFLHMLVAEHPCCTYVLLCMQAELATASRLFFKEIQVCIKWVFLLPILHNAISSPSAAAGLRKRPVMALLAVYHKDTTFNLQSAWATGSWRVGGNARRHCYIFALFSSSSTTIRCGILSGPLTWPGLAVA